MSIYVVGFLKLFGQVLILLNSFPGLAEQPLVLGAVAEDSDGPDNYLLRLGRGGPVEAPHQGARDALSVEEDGVLVVVVGHVGDGPHTSGLLLGDVEDFKTA